MKCILCKENEAKVPDRDSGSQRKEICGSCHAERLREDLRNILRLAIEKNKEKTIKSFTKPRYDDVYYEGLERLDKIAKGEE